MKPEKIIKALADDQMPDLREDPNMLMAALKALKPYTDRLEYDAVQSGIKKERTESVCRLFASGLTAEEITVLLCLRRDEIDDIAKWNKEKISKYAKTLKERKKRHGLN